MPRVRRPHEEEREDRERQPEMAVTDGGSGFAKACREAWPDTRVQRCVFWWCYMKAEYRLPASRILARMPTNDDVDMLYELYGSAVRPDDGATQWGDGLVWSEFHHATAYPYAVD